MNSCFIFTKTFAAGPIYFWLRREFEDLESLGNLGINLCGINVLSVPTFWNLGLKTLFSVKIQNWCFFLYTRRDFVVKLQYFEEVLIRHDYYLRQGHIALWFITMKFVCCCEEQDVDNLILQMDLNWKIDFRQNIDRRRDGNITCFDSKRIIVILNLPIRV